MRNLIFRSLIIALMITVAVGCKKALVTQNTVKLSPKGELNQYLDSVNWINTAGNEIAPNKRPEATSSNSPFFRTFNEKPYNVYQIKPSNRIAREDLGLKYSNSNVLEYLTSSIESITFTDNHRGFISFSHPPTREFARAVNLPLDGIVGGTDIFFFELAQSGDYIFRNIKGLEGVNTEFWESHPFAFDSIIDGERHTLLIWSSDRNSPYRKQIRLDGTSEKTGSADLFYSFGVNGNWSPAKSIDGLNSAEYNEGTPFIYCYCCQPVLFFSSNRNTSDENDYDIYATHIQIDYEKKELKATEKAKLLPKQPNRLEDFDPNAEYINTFADDRFPYIPTPLAKNLDERYIYLSSNRFNKAIEVGKDSIMKNIGGYDIYRFKLPAEFVCEPPPPPRIFVKIGLNELYYGIAGDTLQHNTDILDEVLNLSKISVYDTSYTIISTEKVRSGGIYEIDFGTNYLISRDEFNSSCADAFCNSLRFKTPAYLRKDDTLITYLNCYSKQMPAQKISFSESNGIAMFITGYWHPLTLKNYEEFKQKVSNGSLAKSKFIDYEDYPLYQEVALRNENWFNGFYASIDSVLQQLNNCGNNQKLVISVHGFTDPCGLRYTQNDDSTRYSADGDFVFNGLTVKEGVNMKNPMLFDQTGRLVSLPLPSQRGNAMLAMLRSHFTSETIKNGLETKLDNQSQDLLAERVVFQKDFFGIYNDTDENGNFKRSRCPEIDDMIITMDMPNRPAEPEPCNLPHSRRVMIYLDVVDSLELAMGFKRNECGQIESRYREQQNQKIQKEKKKKAEPIIIDEPETVIVSNEKWGGSAVALPPGQDCVGPCFWIEFGWTNSEESFNNMQKLVTLMGVEKTKRDGSIIDKYVLISETFTDYDEAMKALDAYRQTMRSMMSGVISDFRFNAQIKSPGY